MATNPFDSADDLNPFAQVDVYNPFESASTYSEPKRVDPPPPPVNAASPAANTNYNYNNTSFPPPRNEAPELKFRESEYEDVEAFYQDQNPPKDTPSMNYGATPAPVPPMEPSFVGTSSRIVGGAKVTVVSKPLDDEEEVSFWQLKFYRRFFNVDSLDVLKRCGRSLWPFKYDFLEAISDNPDFYGPFWITTTLIFMMAACANFAMYLQALIDPTAPKWVYDFYKLTYGSGVIYGYGFGVPILFWLYIKWVDLPVTLIEIFCIYGYSLFVYIPVALLCLIPIYWVKWLVVGIGCLLSTSFLIVNLWMPLRGKLGYAIITLIVLALLHVGLALTFRLYFFDFVSQPQK